MNDLGELTEFDYFEQKLAKLAEQINDGNHLVHWDFISNDKNGNPRAELRVHKIETFRFTPQEVGADLLVDLEELVVNINRVEKTEYYVVTWKK